MHDLMNYLRWLYADFPNSTDAVIAVILLVLCFGMFLIMRAGDLARR